MHIRVYVKSLQGFYACEVVSQLRNLCSLKGDKLSVFDTGEQQLDEPIGLEGVDGVIAVKDAVSNRLAYEIFTERKIPMVALSYDYFPLRVPIISTDHLLGTRLALEELVAKGHKRIAFVGHLASYDDRKYFEDYRELLAEMHLVADEKYFFNAEDRFFSGGEKQAQEFVAKGCDATAVLVGSALTAIGFMEELKQLEPQLAEGVDAVCVDAFSLIPVLTPGLVAIDQNINLLVYRALSQIQNQCSGFISRSEMVPPKLVRIQSNPEESYSEFIAACADISEFSNPNYMKAMVTLLGEFNHQIVASDLDKIMCISPLFKNYMMAISVVEYCDSSAAGGAFRVKKIRNKAGVRKLDDEVANAFVNVVEFDPGKELLGIEQEPKVTINFCLYKGTRLLELISVFGNKSIERNSSFLCLCSTLNILVKYYASMKQRDTCGAGASTQVGAFHEKAVIKWNAVEDKYIWTAAALQQLGYTSELEQKIYLNMDFLGRMQAESYSKVQRQIYKALVARDEFTDTVQVRHKSGSFINALMTAKTDSDEPGIMEFTFSLECGRQC